jgi:hypothetical protein
MPSYSKSLFMNDTVPTNTRSIINPISLSFTSAIEFIATGTQEELTFITETYFNILTTIQTLYSSKIATRQYESIPTDYTQYEILIQNVQEMRTKTTNTSILLLLQIAEDTLSGSFNSLALYGDNLLLQIDKADLQKKIDEIITDKNVETTQTTISTNSITISQTFQLAAVFNYYIRIYGAPQVGEGFDPVKIAFLIYILQENGIDPYS